MTQLPATLLEAEARAHARHWFAEFGAVDTETIGLPIVHESYGRLWLRRELKKLAMSHTLNRISVIDIARAGWDDAEDALRELALEIEDRGERLPTTLQVFMMELNARELRRHPPRPRGPRKAKNVFQNIVIAGLTANLVDQYWPDLKPMRHTLSKRVSACDIVADTVKGASIGRLIEYKEVERLWLQWGKWLLPPAHPLAPK